MTIKNSRTRKQLRRESATDRQEEWAKLSPQQQLDSLDAREEPAKRQRARLLTAIENQES